MNDILRGILIYASINSLWQDLYFGTAERYVAYVLENWTDKSITIPLALVILAVAIFWPKEKK